MHAVPISVDGIESHPLQQLRGPKPEPVRTGDTHGISDRYFMRPARRHRPRDLPYTPAELGRECRASPSKTRGEPMKYLFPYTMGVSSMSRLKAGP